MTKRAKVNWAKLWREFDVWYEKRSANKKCDSCGNYKHYDPEWDEQQRKIAKLVESQLR